MALIDTNKLPKVDFAQSKAQAQSQVKANPFGNLNLGKMQVEQDPNFGYNQMKQNQNNVQTQPKPAQQQTAQPKPAQQQTAQQNQTKPVQRDTSSNARITANGNILKTTPAGNTYVYNDKFNHEGEIGVKDVEKFILRIPAQFKDALQKDAQARKLSLNQYILQVLKSYLISRR